MDKLGLKIAFNTQTSVCVVFIVLAVTSNGCGYCLIIYHELPSGVILPFQEPDSQTCVL